MNFSFFIDKAIQVFNTAIERLLAKVEGIMGTSGFRTRSKNSKTDFLQHQQELLSSGSEGPGFSLKDATQMHQSQHVITVQMTQEQYQYFLYRWQEVCKYRHQMSQNSNSSNTSQYSVGTRLDENFALEKQSSNNKQFNETLTNDVLHTQKEVILSNKTCQNCMSSKLQQTQNAGESNSIQEEKKANYEKILGNQTAFCFQKGPTNCTSFFFLDFFLYNIFYSLDFFRFSISTNFIKISYQ